jgi:hypothetical protein
LSDLYAWLLFPYLPLLSVFLLASNQFDSSLFFIETDLTANHDSNESVFCFLADARHIATQDCMLLKECIPLVLSFLFFIEHLHKEHKAIFDPISKSVHFGGHNRRQARNQVLFKTRVRNHHSFTCERNRDQLDQGSLSLT